MKTGKCKLCLIEKPLSKKSHIIPDFMYKELYDEQHKAYRVNFLDFSRYERPSTGEYDQNVLCVDCDSKILGNRYDDYAAKVFGQRDFVQIKQGGNIDDILTIDVCNIDYTKFKLFFLSILWRASISKRKLFGAVRLGPYEEVIREMLYNQDPGEPNDFPCYMISLRKEIEESKELVSAFRKDRSKSKLYTTYSIIIAGFLYIYRVGKSFDLPIGFYEVLINKSNKMKILQIPINDGEAFLKKFLKLGVR